MTSSGSRSRLSSRWRSLLCSDQGTLWFVETDSLLTLLISVLQVSWQWRQGQTLPRERLVPIVHSPSSPSGASAPTIAADDQSSAAIRATEWGVCTSCLLLGWPVETAAWSSSFWEEKDFNFPGDLNWSGLRWAAGSISFVWRKTLFRFYRPKMNRANDEMFVEGRRLSEAPPHTHTSTSM